MKKSMGAGVVLVGVILFFIFSKEASWPVKNGPVVRPDIVAFGDSLTQGVGAAQGMDYPSQLGELLGVEIVNLGVSGETTAGALRRLDEVIERDPAAVLLTLGGNDLKNRLPKEKAFENLREIVTRLQGVGALVVVGGLEIPLYGKGFGKAYEELAKETGAVLVPNVFDGIFGKNQLMSDPIHPNDAGYTIMAGHFHKALIPHLSL